ncbi:MAG: amino acid adenylation domain-containing protein, partial [Tumebacillaceae bacterium]
MAATPSTWNMLLQTGWAGRSQLRAFVGGEALSRELIHALAECTVGVWNTYGPTEATITSTMARMEAGNGPVLIGRPLANTTAYILDNHLQPVPVGVVGELYVGGRQLARGYLNLPELTREVFLPHPFAKGEGEHIYKTGDLARYHVNGQIEHMGRVDSQVKIRGFRIELGEIESVLMQHASIQEAVVVVHEVTGDKRLTAYLVLDSEHPADMTLWRSFLRDRLPTHMVPSAFMVLETMPLTPNGKVDRKALPVPDASAFRTEEYVAPRTAVEETVSGIWADVLRLDRIGVTENFFEAGGHSLLATQVMSRLASTFSVQVPLKAMFEAPTVAELSAHIERLQQEQQAVELIPLERVSRQQPLALSFAQQRLWVLDRLMNEGEGATYNIPGAMRLHGALNTDALERALREIVNRHEVLRTTFAEVDGEPVQVIADFVPDLQRIDLREMPAEERELEVNRLIHAELEREFDLAVGPLFRSSLAQVQEEEHVLILNMHHIISDGWSMDVLLGELMQLYTAFAAGEESPLAPLPIQYADYAVWQRQWLEGEVMNRQLAYWKEKLADLSVLELPTDRPRPAVQTHNGSVQRLELTQELTEALHELSKKQGATLYMTLLAAFQTLLARYSGQVDITVGSPIAGRHRGEVEGLVGLFINMLVMRTDLSGAPTFQDVLNRVRDTALEAYDHQDVPFEKLVQELQQERDMSRSPLFQVMFLWQNLPAGEHDFADLRVSPVEFDGQVSKYDLSLTMWEQSGALYAGFEYNTDLFDAATIERMTGHFSNLLQEIVANPEAPIGQIDFLTAQDRDMYARINGTAVEYDLNHLLTDAFVEQATAHPERIALIFEDRTMTYGELHERSNRLAHFLRAQGVQRNQLVAIMMERSMEMMVGLYGIIMSGAAYVPIDPDYPADRIEYMLADSDARVLLTKQDYLEAMPNVSTLLLLEEELIKAPDAFSHAVIWRDLAECPTDMPEPANVPSDLAYMIYTSGSTGQPKGVLIQQQAILNRLYWHQDTFGCTPDDVVIQRTTMCFDDSVIELFWPLRHGAALSIMPQDVVLDPKRMIEQLNRDHATYMQFVPSLLSVVVSFLQEMPSAERPKLRAIIVSGEALPTHLLQQWFDLFPGTRMANLYGPTEAAVDVTGAIYEAPSSQITIGTPIANTQIYVLDPSGQFCPVNVKGELYVGGVQLAVGYHNKPEKTADAFVPNHLEGTPGDRLYRTGDAVRLLPNGNIEYLGRNDDQVKIRGMRIELGEIESVLMNHEAIQIAVVLAQEVIPGDKRLVAYLMLEKEAMENIPLWHAHLRERVPAYMVPAAFMVLESMPLTPSGKVNRKALPKPDASALLNEAYVEPRTEAEQVIAGIWAEVLHVEKIGVHDNFFGTGGHSLLATQVTSRLAAAFSVHVLLKALFEAPTIAELASHVERLQREQASIEFASIERVSREGQLPLSFAQQRLWVVERMMDAGDSAVYNIPGAMRLRGLLNADALEASLQEIIARHESLRTTFAEVDGEPVQVITDSPLVLEKIDLTAIPRDERDAEVNRLVQAEAQHKFDLVVGPLVRFSLVHVADDEHVLILNMHHIIS